ncbi:MAG: asparagine synthase C-terminal domain-containing protein [Methanoculleaceae archaeon]
MDRVSDGRSIELTGWMEIDGSLLTTDEITGLIERAPDMIGRCGGEFFLRWDGCMVRDLLGVIPGPCPPGSIVCRGRVVGKLAPDPPPVSLDRAIETAVRLRSGAGCAVAFSGGLDSALIAHLSGLECVVVGLEGSHDLACARRAAGRLGCRLHVRTISPDEIAGVLPEVVRLIPDPDPVDVSIATTLWFAVEWAGDHGYTRLLSGFGADELFGGYARYSASPDPVRDLERYRADIPRQIARDQGVAGAHGIQLSLPYTDIRVIRAASAIPATEMVRGGMTKVPLRVCAERHIGPEIAWQKKKAMQYGSGVMNVIRRLARENGYKKSLQRYLIQMKEFESGLHD